MIRYGAAALFTAMTKEAMTRMSLDAAISIDEVLNSKKPSWPVNLI